MRSAIIAAILFTPLLSFGADDVAWGAPVNGLRLGIQLDRTIQEPPGIYARAAIDWPSGGVDRQENGGKFLFCTRTLPKGASAPWCLPDPGTGPAVHVFIENTGSAPADLDVGDRSMRWNEPEHVRYIVVDSYWIRFTITSPDGVECPIYDLRGYSPQNEPPERLFGMLSLRLAPGTTKEIPFPAASIWRSKFDPVIGLEAALDQHYSVRAAIEPHGIRTIYEENERSSTGECGPAPTRSPTELLSGAWPAPK